MNQMYLMGASAYPTNPPIDQGRHCPQRIDPGQCVLNSHGLILDSQNWRSRGASPRVGSSGSDLAIRFFTRGGILFNQRAHRSFRCTSWYWAAACRASSSCIVPSPCANSLSLAILIKMGHTWFNLACRRVQPRFCTSDQSFLDTESAQLAPLETLSNQGELWLRVTNDQYAAIRLFTRVCLP